MPKYAETPPCTLHIQYHATPATHVCACFAATLLHRGIDRAYLDFGQLTHCRLWPWCKLVYVCRFYVSRRRCVGRYVCCSHGVVWGVEGGGDLPVRRHSYGGHRVELWRASDWLQNDKKQLKVKQSRQSQMYLGFNRLLCKIFFRFPKWARFAPSVRDFILNFLVRV